jgi:hypothetical protein
MLLSSFRRFIPEETEPGYCGIGLSGRREGDKVLCKITIFQNAKAGQTNRKFPKFQRNTPSQNSNLNMNSLRFSETSVNFHHKQTSPSRRRHCFTRRCSNRNALLLRHRNGEPIPWPTELLLFLKNTIQLRQKLNEWEYFGHLSFDGIILKRKLKKIVGRACIEFCR